jgi:hypothetical protein
VQVRDQIAHRGNHDNRHGVPRFTPAQAWYFEQNGAPAMPFAVLMEVALQPCGWLATTVTPLDRGRPGRCDGFG